MPRPFALRHASRIAGLALFAALSLFLVAFGLLYANVSDILFFHAAAVPVSAREDVRPLYFALMTLIGGSSGALGLLGAAVTVGPIRGGSTAAAAAVSLAYVTAFIAAAFTAEKLAAATGAPTSWHIMGVLIATTAAAWLATAWGGHGAVPRAGP